MISGRERVFTAVEEELVKLYGAVDLRSPIFDFNYTDYYEAEMGPGLKRKFLSFKDRIDPGKLAEIKLQTNELEARWLKKESFASRPVNLDPGYITRSKLVLASTKNYSHRIYIGKGIYAEIALIFRNKRFVPLETTYPDYRSKGYIEFFTNVRQRNLTGTVRGQ